MIFHLVLQQIFPLYAAYKADSIVKKQQHQIAESELHFGNSNEALKDNESATESTNEQNLLNDKSNFDKSFNLLKEFSKDELDRKKIIEEKARALLLVISATIAITTGSLTYISQLQLSNNILKFAVVSLLVGFLYLIFAIINTIKSLHVYAYYYLLSEDYFEEQNSSIKLSQENEVRIISKLYKNLKLNSLINIRRGNHLSASFTNIRNGVISIALFFMLVLFSKIADSDAKPSPIERKTDSIPLLPFDSTEQKGTDTVVRKQLPDSSSRVKN